MNAVCPVCSGQSGVFGPCHCVQPLVRPEAASAKAEIRGLHWILRKVEHLSPASRRWLIDRLTADLRTTHIDGTVSAQ
jgi:hypothetical protein